MKVALALALAGCGRLDFDPSSLPGGGSTIADLVVAYPMDALPGTRIPSTVAGFDGVCAPCPTVVRGIHDGSYRFAVGNAGTITLPARSATLVGTAPYTVSVWVLSPMPTANSRALVTKGYISETSDTNVFSLSLITGPAGVQFETTPSGAFLDFLSTSIDDFNVHNNVWHHIAARWDGARKSVFIDGVMLAEKAALLVDAPGVEPVHIGVDIDGGPLHQHEGGLDDLRFYRRALTDVEIGELADP